MRSVDPNRPSSFAGTLTVDSDDDNDDITTATATNNSAAATTASATTATTATASTSHTTIDTDAPTITPTETFTDPTLWSTHLQQCADEAHALLNNLRLQEKLNRMDPELDEAQQPLQSYEPQSFHGDPPSPSNNLPYHQPLISAFLVVFSPIFSILFTTYIPSPLYRHDSVQGNRRTVLRRG